MYEVIYTEDRRDRDDGNYKFFRSDTWQRVSDFLDWLFRCRWGRQYKVYEIEGNTRKELKVRDEFAYLNKYLFVVRTQDGARIEKSFLNIPEGEKWLAEMKEDKCTLWEVCNIRERTHIYLRAE